MADFNLTASKEPTVKEKGACADIHTAYIDVNVKEGGNPWYSRISVHGDAVAGAEELRDAIIAAMSLRNVVKEILK